jgi:RNA polymerase sigma factor (sigma-70 family)
MSPDEPRSPAPAVDYAECIVAVARQGDRTAFGRLFEYFGPRLKSYFIRAGLTASQAEELAQETMLTVWRKADQFDPSRAGASTWIFVIARNLRIDLLRRKRSEQSALADPFEENDAPLLADETVGAAEREARVRAALRELSPEQSAVVRLSFFSDTPHGEIARQLGIPLGTVKSRIRLAVARLRELLGDI